jgi:hypothetical protein
MRPYGSPAQNPFVPSKSGSSTAMMAEWLGSTAPAGAEIADLRAKADKVSSLEGRRSFMSSRSNRQQPLGVF